MIALTTPPRPFRLTGRPETGPGQPAVRHPYAGSLIARVGVPDDAQVATAVAGAAAVAADLAARPAWARSGWLHHLADRLGERAEEAAGLVVAESGKPITWARTEITRAVSTFRWAVEEARRWSGGLQRLDNDPTGGSRPALTRRFPRRPVLGITPFNFPVDLVAHELAPAIAVGRADHRAAGPGDPAAARGAGGRDRHARGLWSVLPPTVLVDVPADARVNRDEVLGPVLVVSPVADAAQAFAAVDDSPFGLQAGVFTNDLRLAFRAHRELIVGGAVIGDVPSFRADQMAYGGVEASGVGREGVRCAMEDLTVERVLVLSDVPL